MKDSSHHGKCDAFLRSTLSSVLALGLGSVLLLAGLVVIPASPAFAPSGTYTVTYENTNSDGTAVTSGNAPVDGSTYGAGAVVTVLGNTGSPPLALTGYTFAGWCTNNSAAGPTYCSSSALAGHPFTMPSSDVTLYAWWTATNDWISIFDSTAGVAAFGASVTFTATLTTDGTTTPTGTVDFTSNGSSMGCDTQALTAVGSWWTATCTTTGLALGIDTIAAEYVPGADVYNNEVMTGDGLVSNEGPTDSSSDVFTVTGPAVNTLAPAITGTAVVGDTLTTTPGTWTGDTASFTYHWYSCTDSPVGDPSLDTNCATTGTNADTYTLLAGDLGHYVAVDVTDVGTDTTTTTAFSNTLTVAPQTQTITMTATHMTTFDQSGTYNVTASSNDVSATLLYTVDGVASDTAGCSVSSTGVVSFTGLGVCTIDVNSGADGTYAAAIQAQQALTVPSTSVNTAMRTTFAPGVQNTSPSDSFSSVACPSDGNCVAVGNFRDVNGNQESFTVTETNGVWGDGVRTTFAAGVQNTSPNSYFYSIACPSNGNCVAVGEFNDANGNLEAFTATETNGVWGDGMRTTFAAGVQNASPSDYFLSVACPPDGNCVAVGSFKDVNGYYEAFTATETNGVWGDGVRTTFAAGVQNTSPYSYFYSVACPSDGNCVAVGEFYDANGNNGSFTATETGGVWGNGVPTTFAAGVQNTSPNDYFSSVACPSDGNCVAVGEFYDAAGNYEAFTLGVAVTFALVAQAALSVVSTSGTVGTALTLATSGGSGTGALSYSVVNGTATGCTNTSGTLIATSAGTCLVTATKAADADYASASSVQTTVTFSLAAQAALVVNSTSATYPYSLALTTTGGSGTGALSYSVVNGTATGCTNTSGTLIATSAGTCLVTATKAADADYASASLVQTTVTFTGSPPPPFAQFAQAALTLTSTSGTYGSALTLTSSGGSGTGAMSYAVTSAGTAGCSISAGMLSATSAGSCTVTVTKAADTNYVVASSLATTVTFAQAAQAALTLTSTSATFPSSLTLTSSGGSGTGAVSYAVTASGSAGCSISAGTLSATSAGSCTVTVNKAADTNYLMASSPATTVTFRAKVVPVRLHAIRVNGFVWVGRTVTVTIVGTGFYAQPRITSNEVGTRAVVSHDNGRRLVVRVRLLAGAARGWHTFTITLANGHSCKVNYLVK